MGEKKQGKRVITAKLDADVHLMLKILVKRYRDQHVFEKGKVSISDAARVFVTRHDPELAATAKRQAKEQDALAAINEDDEA